MADTLLPRDFLPKYGDKVITILAKSYPALNQGNFQRSQRMLVCCIVRLLDDSVGQVGDALQHLCYVPVGRESKIEAVTVS